MEQKKTLWIIAAVGAFLLVVLGAAGILYSPAKNTSPTIASAAPVAKNNKNTNTGWTNSSTTTNTETPAPAPVPVTVPENTPSASKVDEMVVVSENTTVYDLQPQKPAEATIDLNALKSELASANAVTAPVQVPAQPQNQNINITVKLPEVEKTAPAQPANPGQKVQIVEKVQKVESAPVAEPAKSTVSKSVTQKKTKTAKAPEVKKPAPKKVTQYWVQVASYSNKKAAENARSILDSNKISSDIFTYRDNRNKLYFRVRIGPYTTKSESEYWQARIMKIPYFEKNDSYITSTVK